MPSHDCNKFVASIADLFIKVKDYKVIIFQQAIYVDTYSPVHTCGVNNCDDVNVKMP